MYLFEGEPLIDTDILNWNGITARYGSIKHFIRVGDLITFATGADLTRYIDAQK